MERRSAAPESAFAKELRSFQTGGVTFSDLLAQLHLHLASGASPEALADVLRAREAVEPLPGDIRDALMRHLEEPSDASGAAATMEAAEAATIILGESGATTADPLPASARSRSLVAGDVLAGRFRLQALVGEGGMSRVFKATDSTPADEYSLAQFIAVKVLARPYHEDAESFAKLQEDVRQLRGLAHPHIVRLFGCYRDDTLIFVTLEFLEGESLYSKLVRASAARLGTGLDGNEARRIIAAVAAALQYAHEHHVVHGDLKPGNVIVDPHGAVKVIDFGMANWIARPRSALERRETINVKVAVTPRYASPQLMARQKPEAGDDVYALACLSYELLTGLHPFDDGSGATTAKFPPPRRAGMTAAEHAAIVHGLQRDRDNRTATVTQFVEEFAPPKRARTGGATGAAWGAAAVLAVLAAIMWFVRHPSSAPAPAPAPAHAPAGSPAPRTVAMPGTEIRDCSTCPAMTVVPGGLFLQGSAPDAGGSSRVEQPQHVVVIAQPFALSAHDVTVAEFGDFVSATNRDMRGCDTYDGDWRHRPAASWRDPGFTQSPRHPVTCVSWNDAVAYAGWLSAKAGHHYRLPSAAEWEYAARAGSDAVQPWEGQGDGACANANVADQSASRRYPGWEAFACDDGYVYTAPVGSFKPNPFGLYDMLGNVFQWTQDCWRADYEGAPRDGSARLADKCTERELRGGSWFTAPSRVRASYRNHFAADYRTSTVGVRLAREVGP